MKSLCDLHPMPNVKGDSLANRIMDLIRRKQSVTQMATSEGKRTEKIINCIVELIKSGNEVLKDDLKQLANISDGLFQQICDVLPTDNTMLTIFLKPLKLRLPDHITYDQIKLVLAYQQVRYHLKELGSTFIDPDAVERPSTSSESSHDIAKSDVGDIEEIVEFDERFTQNIDEVMADMNIPVEKTAVVDTYGTNFDDTDDEIFAEIDLEEEIRKKNEHAKENYIEILELENEICREMGEPDLNKSNLEQLVRQEEERDKEEEMSRLIDLEETIMRDANNITVNTTVNANNLSTSSSFSKKSQQAPVKLRTIAKPGRHIKYESDSDEENDKVTTPPAVAKRKLPSWFETGIPLKAKVPKPPCRHRNNLF